MCRLVNEILQQDEMLQAIIERFIFRVGPDAGINVETIHFVGIKAAGQQGRIDQP